LRYGAILGAGFAISILTRPFETIFLVIGAGLYFVIAKPAKFRLLKRAVPVICLATLPGIVLTLAQNKAVTGSWTMLPYQLSRYEYGVPTTFTFQPNPTPHQPLSHQEEIDYKSQTLVHGSGRETLAGYWHRLVQRIRFYRFFLLAPLYIAFAVFLITAFRCRAALWIIAALALFALGTTFYPYFFPHYIAAAACLFLLAAIIGLQRIKLRYAAQAILVVCAAHFLFWYGLHLTAGIDTAAAMNKYDSWDYIDFGDPEGRFAIAHQLDALPGKQLVFVHYSPRHIFHDWIHNAADIDRAHVVWARDMGASENRKLLHYFPNRTAWIFEPDVWPPALKPYRSE
jgi:hypothetical protein